MATNWYEVDDLQEKSNRLNGELVEAIRLLRAYREQHDEAARRRAQPRCQCEDCREVEGWLARNRPL